MREDRKKAEYDIICSAIRANNESHSFRICCFSGRRVRECVQHLGHHSNLDGWSDTKGLIMTWVIIQLSDFARHGYAQSCRKRSDYGPDEIYKHIVAQYPVQVHWYL
jgi:hypothetical protein